MAADFEKQMKSLRERSALMEERARLAMAQANITKANLEHHKMKLELDELAAAKKKS